MSPRVSRLIGGIPDRERSTALLALAAGLGIAGDLLFRIDSWGLNGTVWIAALAAAGVGLVRPGRSRWPLILAAVAAIVFAWRDAPPLTALGGVLVFVALATALLEDPLTTRPLGWAAAGLTTLFSAGILAIGALLEAWRALGDPDRRRGLGIALRGALLAGPLVFLIGGLFVWADPVFRSVVSELVAILDLANLIGHALLILVFGWLAAGLLRGLWLPPLPVRLLGRTRRGPEHEIVVALALISLLFVAFLLVQARSLIGGSAFVETTAGIGYAEYARSGFFQLVAVAALMLPMLLAAEWAVSPRGASRGRFQVLAWLLVGLTLAVLASAANRMRLYTDVFGLSELRLYASAFMVWLGFLFAWLATTVVRGERRWFMAGAIGAAVTVAVALVLANPAGIVVRTNLARAEAGVRRFDAAYALSLGADAVPALVEATPRLDRSARCRVGPALLERWAGPSDTGWRGWTLARSRARDAVRDTEPVLRRIAAACGPAAVPRGSRQGSGDATASATRLDGSANAPSPTASSARLR